MAFEQVQDIVEGALGKESTRAKERTGKPETTAPKGRRKTSQPSIRDVLRDAAKLTNSLLAGGTEKKAAVGQLLDRTDADLSALTGDVEGLNGTFAAQLAALVRLVQDAGGTLSVTSGFRTYEEQACLYGCYIGSPPPGCTCDPNQALAAAPGTSNHESGMAADLNGSLDLAHQLAPLVGLHFPLTSDPWADEGWHVEPINGGPTGTTQGGKDQGVTVAPPTTLGPGQILAIMQATILGEDLPETPTSPETPDQTAQVGDELQRFLDNLALHESGGNCAAKNPSGASGKYQFLQGTWNGAASAAGLDQYVGQDPASLPCEVQDQVAASYAQSIYDTHGTWGDVASVWYSGQPLGSAALDQGQGQYPTIREYVDRMRSETGLT